MPPSLCAPISLPASPPLAMIWSAGSSEPAAQAIRTLLAAAGPWTGHASSMSLSLQAPLPHDPQILGAGGAPWHLTLRRSGTGPTLLALYGSGPRGARLSVELGDLDFLAPRTPEETGNLLGRALNVALCPLLARRADLALLLAHARLADVGARQAILRRHGSTWRISWAGRYRTALPPRYPWGVLLGYWMTQVRRVVFSSDGVPFLQGLHNLPLYALPNTAHHRLALANEIALLSEILSLDQTAR